MSCSSVGLRGNSPPSSRRSTTGTRTRSSDVGISKMRLVCVKAECSNFPTDQYIGRPATSAIFLGWRDPIHHEHRVGSNLIAPYTGLAGIDPVPTPICASDTISSGRITTDRTSPPPFVRRTALATASILSRKPPKMTAMRRAVIPTPNAIASIADAPETSNPRAATRVRAVTAATTSVPPTTHQSDLRNENCGFVTSTPIVRAPRRLSWPIRLAAFRRLRHLSAARSRRSPSGQFVQVCQDPHQRRYSPPQAGN